MTKAIRERRSCRALSGLDVPTLAQKLDIGEVTLRDIIDTLKRPNRDRRDDYPQPLIESHVLDMKDLYEGLEMQGTVRKRRDFGAFVDIGVSEDGLVNISKLKKGFVKHPLDVVASGDIVTVWVEGVR